MDIDLSDSPVCIFYKNGEIIYENFEDTDEIKYQSFAQFMNEKGLLNLLCVDTCHSEGSRSRYGYWGHKKYKWIHVPFEEFPEDFKSKLLLLGIR